MTARKRTTPAPVRAEVIDAAKTPCEMTFAPPFDFGQCATHDTTFPLGQTCKFHDRDPVEVYADEADEQRARSARLELALEMMVDRVREAATFDNRINPLRDDIERIASIYWKRP